MNIEIREYTQDDVKDMIEIWNEVVEKDKEEIIKKHITNMNKFCNENIDFESGKEQLELIYKYYTKRFSDKDILYKNLIVLKNEIQNAPIKRGWFKQVKFKNKTLLVNRCDILKKIIDVKRQELENFVSCV